MSRIVRFAKRVAALVPGALLLSAWEAFSLLYDGALVPNTAIAKLTSALPITERIEQGVQYLISSTLWDPWTTLVVDLSERSLAAPAEGSTECDRRVDRLLVEPLTRPRVRDQHRLHGIDVTRCSP